MLRHTLAGTAVLKRGKHGRCKPGQPPTFTTYFSLPLAIVDAHFYDAPNYRYWTDTWCDIGGLVVLGSLDQRGIFRDGRRGADKLVWVIDIDRITLGALFPLS